MRGDAIRILRGEVTDETVFAAIYCIDEGDRWDDPASLRKANPNYGVSVFEQFLLDQLAKAKRSASKQSAFRTKHLNDWVGAKLAWMNMLAWQRQKRRFEVSDFAGCPCWVGVDLASKLDVAAVVLLFEKGDSYYVIPRFYVPESAVEENEKYQQFLLDELIVSTPGNMTDYAFIEEELKELAAQGVDVQDIAFDPAQAAYLMTRLEQEGLPTVEMAQSVRNLSEPMKEVEALILSRRLWHDGNAAMTWMMGNVVARGCQGTRLSPQGKDGKQDRRRGSANHGHGPRHAGAGHRHNPTRLRGDRLMFGLFEKHRRADARDRIEPTISNLVDGEVIQSSGMGMFEVFGNPTTASGAVVSPESAMRVSAVFAAVSLLAGAIAQLPLPVFERVDGHRKRAEHDYWWLLNEQFSSGWSSATGWEFIVGQMLLRG